MTRQGQLDLIRAKCIEANSEIGIEDCQCCGQKECDRSTTGCPWYRGRPIRLADVLLAIGNMGYGWAINGSGYFFQLKGGTGDAAYEVESIRDFVAYWNLRKDDLTEQSDATVAFLADLLK